MKPWRRLYDGNPNNSTVKLMTKNGFILKICFLYRKKTQKNFQKQLASEISASENFKSTNCSSQNRKFSLSLVLIKWGRIPFDPTIIYQCPNTVSNEIKLCQWLVMYFTKCWDNVSNSGFFNGIRNSLHFRFLK